MPKVLARIPSLVDAGPPEAGPAAERIASPDPAPAPSPRDPRRRAASRQRFPVRSIFALAVLAATAWGLASWNDARRFERNRLERLARMQSFTAGEGTVAR